MTTSASTPVKQQFQANSLFAVDYTAGSGQPLGFDQYASFYRQYLVTGCKVSVKLTLTSTTTNPVHVCLVPYS